ncbi:PEP-CTERM sorting domain-containing protein [Edaphobacter albus]|uniref:PEP-CTERM sorting domain-containing protein n=1 Tax=Edaphobacter sp. 4G125 TaxID=2763071 RepID=UPI0016467771|nr:PEP-CTERM sorting domain-containing protein [Edaphobacter sp. 4G125]QNI36785.1 PEP-CTERM sorting domain-containing protein [Edaphobacter sp. 4G125]
MRNFFSALVLIFGLAVAPVAAHASPVTYNLALTNVIGNLSGGTGSFTIDDSPSGFFDTFYQNGTPGNVLADLTFSIGGNTFTLADSIGTASVNFLLGNVASINYAGFLNGNLTISLASGFMGYTYTDFFGQETSTGIITASQATPEPSTLLLFGTGALGFAAFGLRKIAA